MAKELYKEENVEYEEDVQQQPTVKYTDDNIRHLSDMEHVRTRPGMYIGRLGDGSLPEDGIYVLLKEVLDNSIDEFKMNAGKRIEVDIEDNLRVSVRDYGRGIPQGKLIEAVSVLNTGGKYDSKAFKKSVGLNGVGVKAVNALSCHFEVRSYREGKVRIATFERGELKNDKKEKSKDETGTFIFFEPDNTLFKNYSFHDDIVENMLRNYTYLNTGLTIMYNGRRIVSRNGLEDLLTDRMTIDGIYPIIHLKGEDIEIAFTHANQYGEEYYILCLFVFGLGLGCMMGVIMTAVQNSSKQSEIGMTTSAVNLIRSVGATIGTAVFAMLIANKINGELQTLLPPEVYDLVPHNSGVLDMLAPDATGMPQLFTLLYTQLHYTADQIAQTVHDILLAFANSVDFAFIAGGCLMLLLALIGFVFKVEENHDEDNEVVLPED